MLLRRPLLRARALAGEDAAPTPAPSPARERAPAPASDDARTAPARERGGPPGRAEGLDGLRGLAALGIFVVHAWLYAMPRPNMSSRETLAEYAVHELRMALVLFFVLSGYLLWIPWADARRRAPDLARYGVRRAARVLPAYYVALAGSLVLLSGAALSTGARLPEEGGLWRFLVFAQNFDDGTLLKLDPPMWSLAVEVSFYLALPIFGWLAFRRALRGLGPVLVPVALLAGGVLYNRWLSGQADAPLFAAKVLPAMLPYFAVGMLAAVALHGEGARPWRRLGARGRHVAVASALLLAAGLVLGNAWWHAHGAQAGSQDLALRIWRDLPGAAGFGLLIALTAGAASRRALGWLSWRPLAYVGTVSYAFYLWHVPLMVWLRRIGLDPGDPVVLGFVAFPLTLAVSAVSWHLLESPVLARAQRFGGRRRAAGAATAAPRRPAARPASGPPRRAPSRAPSRATPVGSARHAASPSR